VRKPQQMINMDGGVYVISDDGAMFEFHGRVWVRLPDLPQDEHEESETAHPSKWRPAGLLPIFSVPHNGSFAHECQSEDYFLACKRMIPSTTMIQAHDAKDALQIWRGRKDKSVDTRIKKLKIGDEEYDYIVDCIPF
jgi:hypothetical protein